MGGLDLRIQPLDTKTIKDYDCMQIYKDPDSVAGLMVLFSVCYVFVHWHPKGCGFSIVQTKLTQNNVVDKTKLRRKRTEIVTKGYILRPTSLYLGTFF